MTLDEILQYMGHGIVLRSVELVQEENEEEGATEEEIDSRIDLMDHDEMIEGVAQGFLLMREHPEMSELEEAEFESSGEDLFEEIHEYLKSQDSDAPDED